MQSSTISYDGGIQITTYQWDEQSEDTSDFSFYEDDTTTEDTEDDIEFPDPLSNNYEKEIILFLENFLDDQYSLLTPKISEFISKESKNYLFNLVVCKIFINFIVQLKEKEEEESELEENSETTTTKQINREFNEQDKQKYRRSYRAVTTLHSHSQALSKLINIQLETIVKELFKIFLPGSKGIFAHFKLLFTEFNKNYPVKLQKILIENDSELIKRMFPFINVNFISDCIIDLFASNEGIRQENYVLARKKMIEDIGFDLPKLFFEKKAISAFRNFLERMAYIRGCSEIFERLWIDEDFLQRFLKCEEESIEMMVLLLDKSKERIIKFTPGTDEGQYVENFMTPVGELARKLISDNLVNFCNSFMSRDFPNNRVGLFRIKFFKILVHVSLNNLTTEVIESMSKWIYDFPNNDIFKVFVTKIIRKMIIENLPNVLKLKKLLKTFIKLNDETPHIMIIVETFNYSSNPLIIEMLSNIDGWKEYSTLINNKMKELIKFGGFFIPGQIIEGDYYNLIKRLI